MSLEKDMADIVRYVKRLNYELQCLRRGYEAPPERPGFPKVTERGSGYLVKEFDDTLAEVVILD